MIRIAIIDDHEMVREGLRMILQSEPDFAIDAPARLPSSTNRRGRIGPCLFATSPAAHVEMSLWAIL